MHMNISTDIVCDYLFKTKGLIGDIELTAVIL